MQWSRVCSTPAKTQINKDIRFTTCYGYSGSKVALNRLTRMLALELAPEGIRTVVFNPGRVQTDMGGKNAPQAVDETVCAMINVIESLSPETSGQFLIWEGKQTAW